MPLQKQIAVLGSFLTNPQSDEYATAEELGYLLAQHGFNVICGGHGGISNALVSGVGRGGGLARGVAMEGPRYPRRNARMNPLVTETIRVPSIAGRLETLAGADGYIFFSGGIGTLAEFAFIWHSRQLARDFGRPLILLSRDLGRLLEEIRQQLMIKHKYFRLVHFSERPRDALAILTRDYSLRYDNSGNFLYKQAVSFDLDGIIVESPEETFIRVCENGGYFFRPAEVIAAFRESRRFPTPPDGAATPLICILEKLGITGRSAADLAAELRRELSQVPALHDDVVDILRHFKENGFFTVALSPRPPAQAQEILAAHSLTHCFDFVAATDRTAARPLWGQLEKALAAAGVPRQGMLHVSDALSYATPAASTRGVTSVLLDRYLVGPCQNGTVAIRCLDELKYLVRRGSG